MGKCLKCRAEFNRSKSRSKLYCPPCEEPDEKPKDEDRSFRGQLARVKAKKEKKCTGKS